MRHVSLFSGMGGFDAGFARAGIPTVAWSEIEKNAASVMRHHYPDAEELGDVTTIVGTRLRSADGLVLTGGFPCQDVSVAGRRAGLAGERSGLFFDFARLAEQSAADWVVVENVPGLLTSNGGADFGTVLDTLAGIGYAVAWRVLDARFFGVAQRRRRVFLVGCRGADVTGPGQVLDLCEGGGGNPAAGITPGSLVAAGTPAGVGGGGLDGLSVFRKGRRAMSATDHETWVEDVVSPTLNTFDNGGETRATVLTVSTLQASGGDRGHRIDAEGAAGGHLRPVEGGVRRLTPVECERLQGFPDDWSEVGRLPDGTAKRLSDSARYRLAGNAVCVPVAHWVGARIRAVSEGSGSIDGEGIG